ncbi:MAG: diguanylate cyclase [Oxalicibacterium faecigallinarum]|uniref:sensor domain-containing protein n=1 Tax=Oxalicibacterium faecigallinarum TaxID=573741 RepID=UPI002807228B|nr:diguanylate cyclase [Oxalicibacterium faecigallinarum]MDQ7969749.1 diguanylate cyclase [Oxalicibacterium faecigallinarum]
MDTPFNITSVGFIDLLPDAICIVDETGRFVFVSSAFERIFGYPPHEVIGKPMINLVHPDDRANTLAIADDIMTGNPRINIENRYIRKDGEIAHIMWSARWSPENKVRIAVARDITNRKKAETVRSALYAISEAAHVAEDLPDLFERMHGIISTLLPAENFSIALHDAEQQSLNFAYHVDQHQQSSAVLQQSAEKLYAEIVSTHQPVLVCTNDRLTLPPRLQTVGNQHALCWLAVPLLAKNGTIGALFLRSYNDGSHYTEQDKELLRFVSVQIATAVERTQLYARLQHASQYDPLTDLPNRGLLFDRLRTSLARARRRQEMMAVLFLDLDRFKEVNDTLGHAAGDQLLQEVARRLKQCVRETDTVARIGGDEFVILIESMQQPDYACIVADKIHATLGQPLQLDEHVVHILSSIGIAHYPNDGESEQSLLDHADAAMYEQKQQRKKDTHFGEG